MNRVNVGNFLMKPSYIETEEREIKPRDKHQNKGNARLLALLLLKTICKEEKTGVQGAVEDEKITDGSEV